jgi:hypothetical protein
MKTKLEIEGLKILTSEDVENLMCSAIEGGSNYWYFIKQKSSDRVREATQDMEGEPFVDRLLMAVQRGAVINVFDVEDFSNKLGTLTPQSWAKAEELMIKNHRSHLGDVLAENDDATTGDVFFQLALMGEIVYG